MVPFVFFERLNKVLVENGMHMEGAIMQDKKSIIQSA